MFKQAFFLSFVIALFGSAMALADDLADAKSFISKQLEQIKANEVQGLKDGFTDRLKDRIDADMVKKAQKETSKYTIEDLVASVEKKTDGLKIKMKNGRSLTTLVKVKDQYKADTIWFK